MYGFTISNSTEYSVEMFLTQEPLQGVVSCCASIKMSPFVWFQAYPFVCNGGIALGECLDCVSIQNIDSLFFFAALETS